MKANEALGPNGLHAGFFQHFWLVDGDLVKTKIKRVFEEKKVPSYLNKAYIALIPKIQGSETIGNYKPISPCNMVYKIITKIIVARLRPFLSEIVASFQSAFVPGRRGTDNAIMCKSRYTLLVGKEEEWAVSQLK